MVDERDNVGIQSAAEAVRTAEWYGRLQMFVHALTSEPSATEIMEIVVHQAIAGLDAEGGVLALLDDGVLTPVIAVGYAPDHVAAFGTLTVDLDLPLTTAARLASPVFVTDPDDRQVRFPAFGNVRSPSPSPSKAWAVMPLVLGGEVIGVLGLTFRSPQEFDEPTQLYLCALAEITALGLRCTPTIDRPRSTGADDALPPTDDASDDLRRWSVERARDEIEHLRRALVTRDQIGQAKGIIRSTTGVGDDEAFAALRSQSQHQNRKLIDVAREVIEHATRRR